MCRGPLQRQGDRRAAQAYIGFTANPQLCLRDIGPRRWANNTRRDRQYQLSSLEVIPLAREQSSRDRQIADAGNTIGCGSVFVADQTAQDLGFTITQAQDRVGVSRTDLKCGGAARALDLFDHRADLQAQLDGHFIVGGDSGFNVEFETDIQIADVLGHQPAGTAAVGGGDHWHFVADQNTGFFFAAGADLGVGQSVEVTDFAPQVNQDVADTYADTAGIDGAQAVYR